MALRAVPTCPPTAEVVTRTRLPITSRTRTTGCRHAEVLPPVDADELRIRSYLSRLGVVL